MAQKQVWYAIEKYQDWSFKFQTKMYEHLSNLYNKVFGARGVMVIVVGNGHGDMSSNSGRDWLHFT